MFLTETLEKRPGHDATTHEKRQEVEDEKKSHAKRNNQGSKEVRDREKSRV